jgi:hypothetical protein
MSKHTQGGRRWDEWQVQPANVAGEEQLLFHNNRYHVFFRKYRVEGVPHAIIWLSIRNNDRSTRRDWRDFQRIKNELVGPEYEMVEIYPSESHKVDTSNQYHLWGYDSISPVFTNNGLGWMQGRTVWNGKSPTPPIPGTENAVQRVNHEEDSTV